MNRYTTVRELVKDPSLSIKDIAQQTGYDKGHVSRLRKAAMRQELCREEIMSENKTAKTPADGPVAWGCQCGKLYTVTCISSKPAKREWVSLTDEEVSDAIDDVLEGGGWLDVARALEAKIKEKNT